jgi:hypothetical protein
MNITVHIERLVLDGVPVAPADRPVLQAALESELGRLLRTGRLPADLSSAAVPGVAGGDVRLAASDTAARTGRRIAGSVHAGLAASIGGPR